MDVLAPRRVTRALVHAAVLAVAALGASACDGHSDRDVARPSLAPPAAPTAPVPAPTTAPTTDAGPDASAPRTIHHVLSTGQSLAVGALGSPPLSVTQPYDNLMFAGGAIPGAGGLGALVPLVEGTGTGVETPSSGFANLVTKLARDAGKSHDLLISVHAVGGAPYRLVAKGTAPYAQGMAEVAAGMRLARERGDTYDVTAVTSAHGASDHVERNTHYREDLIAWQRDYEADVKAFTGQATPVPLFHTQYSSFTIYDATSEIPAAQLRAHVEAPGKVILVGPRYPLLYGPDGVHLTNDGYRLMGEQYAKAYRRVVVERGTWEPVRPKTVARAGAVITVTFFVPAPPLVLDTTRAVDPGHMGFEYVDEGPATPSIASVAVSAPDTVTITLSEEPTAPNGRLRYAYAGTPGAHGGLATGPRGNLRDSDATPSRHGFALFNWCVHFDEPVP